MKKNTNLKITIIGGSGKMGKWFQGFFESHGIAVISHGRKSRESLSDVVKKTDIALVSVPISQVTSMVEEVIPHMKEDQLLMDISSLKAIPMKGMKAAKCGTLGTHPLFGPSILSPMGQKIVFCEEKTHPHSKHLRTLFSSSGMEIIDMTPEEHDQQMALIQALTHSINILYAKTLSQAPFQVDTRLQTPLFKLQSLTMQRVLQQDPSLMADIQLLNPHFLPVLNTLVKQTKILTEANEFQDRELLLKNLTTVQDEYSTDAAFSLRQTNKILQMIDEKPLVIPSKKSLKKTSGSVGVAYLGPEGTNTHQAALQIFHNTDIYHPQQILDDVFKTVAEGKADMGVVPAENSLHGTVRETLDLLSDSPLCTIGSFDLPIHHALLSMENDFQSIHTVISHPQALAQCKNWLTLNLPHAKTIPAASTTAALSTPRPGEAYISAEIAEKIYSLPILARNIEDTSTNTTRFYVIAQHDEELSSLNRSNTLLFLTIQNRVGILRDILDVFAQHAISLNKLESRPSLEKLWDYCFYIEVDHQETSPELINALNELESLCTTIRILGRT